MSTPAVDSSTVAADPLSTVAASILPTVSRGSKWAVALLGLAALGVFCSCVRAAPAVPLDLPRPDDKPGDATRPVKVYILAGQSNMVGMGDLTGARPEYAKVYHTADASVIAGATPVGRNERGAALDVVATQGMGVYDAGAVVHGADGQPIGGAAGAWPVRLGTAAAELPAIRDGQTLAVTATIDVPVNGNYFVRTGFDPSTYNTTTLDGQEAYKRELGGKPVLTPVTLEKGRRYPVHIRYQKSGSAAFWLERVDMPGHGDLVTVTRRDRKFLYLLDDAGKWLARPDVIYKEARLNPASAAGPLSATSNNGKAIGPEVGFGAVLGTFHDEQVLLIKTAQGNRSLGFDFRPPSSGRTDPDSPYEGFEYRAMVQGVRDTLAQIDQIVPGYQGRGYEIAGFFWFQGHKDSGASKEEYQKHLVNLINDLRQEFKAPKMKAVVATVGFHGYRISAGPWHGIWQAQMAVGDPRQHPEFAGNVASVDTRDYWREVNESPRSQDYHYHRNAETYLLIGEAAGRAMVRLLGGEAAAIPKSDREARVTAEMAAEAARPAPTEEQTAAHRAAIRPFILESALATFVGSPRNLPAIQAGLKGEKPAKPSPFIGDMLDEAVEFYQAAGVRDYDWMPVGPDLRTTTWDYLGFDLPGRPGRQTVTGGAGAAGAAEAAGGEEEAAAPAQPEAKTKPGATLKVTPPAGMEGWMDPQFDAAQAGWKRGVGPFGESAEKVVLPEWAAQRIAGRVPKTLLENDVLLMRQTVELPPLRDGYRYRIRVAGSIRNNMGEGFAIYVNGRLLAENHEGVLAWRRQGGVPRGVLILPEHRELFKDGRITLAVSHFPMSNWSERFVPPGQPVSVWVEEQKLPPLGD